MRRLRLLSWLIVTVTVLTCYSLLDVPFLLRRIPLILRRISVRYFSAKPETKLNGADSTTNQSLIEEFRYRASVSRGRPLVAERSLYKDPLALSRLGFPLDNFTHREAPSEFVFVTAADDYYIYVSLDAVARIQSFFPNRSIYFYDLSDGVLVNKVDQIQRLCNVHYRKFDFGRYPGHVRQLETYAFKPIIVHELMHIHETVFWVDASVRMQTSNLEQVYQQAVNSSRGVVLFDDCAHNIFMATHSQMYRYLPITKDSAVKVGMYGASVIFICRSKELYNSVLRWWFLCALEQYCIAPTSQLYCKFDGGREQYGRCHRYDQSALNILLANYFMDEHESYVVTSAASRLLTVRRSSYGREQLSVCQTSGSVTRISSTTFL